MILKYGVHNGKGETVVYIKDNITSVEEIEGSHSPIFHHYSGDKTHTYFGDILDNKEIIFMYLMNDDFKTIKIYKKA
ncbi:hypothetical protein AM4_057 [Lactococcus phage AM4]|uniref:Uncharacterized protein n=2 Tax=Audreyjarvisvirus AM4 TaxID=2845189 RepID=A0A1W6JKE4_9CAUD|nr:hypothetical protein H1Z35_gp194 [Lactococcus phage AM4]ARM66716.1 hypothetical protein AM4_057 [Lactococcus phage AM4]ARM66949.1 hypothetical protein AM5_096 [Lactococcus phage AM5]